MQTEQTQLLLSNLSEAKLFTLLQQLQKLARRSALDADNPRELEALQALQSVAQQVHGKKLNKGKDHTF